MDFQRLRYFLAVERERSFSRAAQRCHVSQPSLSNQIKKLEDELGGVLFHRAHSGIDLTEFGAAFLPYALEVIGAVEQAQSFSQQSAETLQRPVRLGAIPTIAPYLLPALIGHLKEAHPEAEFEILEDTTAAQLRALEQREVDFVLLSPPTELDDKLHALHVLTDELLVTLPRNHKDSQQGELLLSALQNQQLILLEDAHCLTGQTRKLCQAEGLNVNVTVRSAQIETLLGMVEQGLGFTFTPSLALARNHHYDLCYHSITPRPFTRTIQLVWHQQLDQNHLNKLLRPTLEQWAARQAGD